MRRHGVDCATDVFILIGINDLNTGRKVATMESRSSLANVLNPFAQNHLHFDLTSLSFSIFGFLLVIMMLIRPEGLLPERRRKLELTEGIGTGDTEAGAVIEVRA